jgi:peptidoglycan/LPS O-acetylase OafA/YrhL
VRTVSWFQIIIGIGIVAIWPMLLVAGEVPEVAAGQRDIWFHIAAEAVTGSLLIAAGTLTLRRHDERSRLLAAFALGALLYTAINSPGYYAELGQWAPVGMLLAVGLGAVLAFVAVVIRAGDGASDAPDRPVGDRPVPGRPSRHHIST